MHIGIPKEVKTLEGRVGLIPAAVAEMVAHGHEVVIENGAGVLSGYPDQMYRRAGADIASDAAEVYEKAKIIVKVKEPVESELAQLRDDHILFSYLHLAPNPVLIERLLEIGLTAIGFETVQLADGRLPLLAPMSDIAGRLATQIGTNLLHQPQGGKGLLLGGLPTTERGRVVILGAGVSGEGAAILAAAMGAEVIVFDLNRDKLERMRALGNNVTALYSYQDMVRREVQSADLLIGAVLITGQKAPHVVTTEMVRSMNPGSVIIDIAVDQGGCVETTRPTNYEAPTYLCEDVVHFAVTNMPGAVPRSASQALSAALIPYLLKLSESNWQQHQELVAGINLSQGKLIHPALQRSVA